MNKHNKLDMDGNGWKIMEIVDSCSFIFTAPESKQVGAGMKV